MENQVVTQSPEGSGGLALSGLYRVIFSPVDFFNDLKKNPKILVPYLFLIVILLLSFFTLKDLILDQQIAAMAEQGQLDNAPENIRQIMMITTAIGMVLYAILGPLVIAALGYMFGNMLTDNKVSFMAVLSVAIFGEMLFSLTGLIMIPIMLAKGTMMASLSPAILVADQGMESFMYVLLSKISLFHIWEIIVVGIGLSVFYEVPRNKGYILSVLSVGMVSIIHVVIAGVKSIM